MKLPHTQVVGEIVFGVALVVAGFGVAARWRPSLVRSGLSQWRFFDPVARVVFALWGIGLAAILYGTLR